jgi:branched-chain amino acid transport system permease protein
VVAVSLPMAVLVVLFQRTNLGLQMRASAFAPEVSKLLGVRVTHMFTAGWALASLTGSLAGLLVAPAVFVAPTNFDPVLVFGFTAAVLGGLESPPGALVGGVLLGLALSYVSGYLGAETVTLGALVILIAVLMVRPQGLFAHERERRV